MTYRNRAFLRAVATLPCVSCGTWRRTQAAHANLAVFGKSGAHKASDAAVMALCWTKCHPWLDQGRDGTRDEKREFTFRWICATYIELIERNALIVLAEHAQDTIRTLRQVVGDEASAMAFVSLMERGRFGVNRSQLEVA